MSKLLDWFKSFIKSKYTWIALVLALLVTASLLNSAHEQQERIKAQKANLTVKEIYSFEDLPKQKLGLLEIYEKSDGFKKIVAKEKDGSTLYVLPRVAPSILTVWLQEEVLPNKVKFELKDEKSYPAEYSYAEQKAKPFKPWFANLAEIFALVGMWLLEHFYAIAMLLMMLFLIRATTSGLGKQAYQAVEPEDIKGSWDDLIGMDDIKKEVKAIIEVIENAEEYKNNGVEKPFNIMFTGPAGTGKSKLAGYFAKELGYPIILAEGSSLENGFVGGGSRTLKSIYKAAQKLEKCVVFIDEAQSLFYKRGASMHTGSGKYADDTANTFLSILDGVSTKNQGQIIWVVASNFDDHSLEMDEAMLRRFQLKVNFRLPNKEERKNILKKYFQINSNSKESTLSPPSEADLKELAEITAELSPAMLETIVSQAKMSAISDKKQLTREVLFKSFERVIIGLTDRQTTAELHKTRQVIAHHELGHFFVQLHFALDRNAGNLEKAFEDISTLKISTESVSKMNALGYVLSKQDELKLLPRNTLEEKVVQLYGGLAAEEVIYGVENISTGASDDIEKATRLLTTMVSRLSMYSNKKLNYSELAKQDINNEKILSEIESMSETLYEKAKSIILIHQEDIKTLAPILLDKFVMSKDEIAAEYTALKKKD